MKTLLLYTKIDKKQSFYKKATSSEMVNSWLGWLDSNQRMAEPKSAALPLGDTPKDVFIV